MKFTPLLFRSAVFGLVALLFVAGGRELSAQTVAEVPPAAATPASPEELSQAELLKSYMQLRDQLHAMLAIANSRAEAEATARAQAAAISERLESIKVAMEAERERDRIETANSNVERERFRAESQRANAEREWQQAELERSNRTVLWVAGACGGIGLLAILLTPLLHWWTINRLAATAWSPALPASGPQGMLPEGNGALAQADEAVTASNQRLMTAIERMERRIFDFESRWVQPPGTATITTLPHTHSGNENEGGARASTNTNIIADHSTRLSVLMAKGQSLLDMGKTMEALTCYNEVLKIDLNHPEALVKRGAALERLKQDDEAIQCYDRAIKADRKMTLAYLHKGAVCNRLERYEEALKCYQQALIVEEEAR